MATEFPPIDQECQIPLGDGKFICCPAFPEPCSYVRLVDGDEEVVYWDHQEWMDDPEEVMGAILGALKTLIERA